MSGADNQRVGTMSSALELTETMSLVIVMPSTLVQMTDDQFFEFCQINRDLRIERNADGDILIMPPAGFESGYQNGNLTTQLYTWAKRDGRGVALGSSAGFKLPNGATRSPDAAWVLKSRLKSFSTEQKRKFLPLCPDFAVELKSPTDRLSDLKAKMQEYAENGAQLGWLIHPGTRQVFIYRPNHPVQCLENPRTIAGDPVLPGFVLDLEAIWEPDL